MDGEEELGGAYVISVDELGLTGLWNSIREVRRAAEMLYSVTDQSACFHLSTQRSDVLQQVFESRLPLQNVTLPNKVGRLVQLEKLSVQCVCQLMHACGAWTVVQSEHAHIVVSQQRLV